jgi:hypothetical protein
MALSNISTRLGLVNGARGRAVGVVSDPEGTFPTLLLVLKGSPNDQNRRPVRPLHASAEVYPLRAGPTDNLTRKSIFPALEWEVQQALYSAPRGG